MALMAAAAMALTACSYGVYSVNSGMADEGYVCFTGTSAYDITVVVDGESQPARTVKKEKAYKARRNMRRTSQGMVAVKPGSRQVKVMRGGKEVYSKTLFISATETKIIDL